MTIYKVFVFFMVFNLSLGFCRSGSHGENGSNSNRNAADLEMAREALGKKDYPTALRYLEKAAKVGNADAQMLLGYLLIKGMGTDADDSAAEPWPRKAAAQGHADAMFFLARLLLRKAPILGKSVTWEAQRAWIASCERMERELWMENAALMGQPVALLMNCLSKSDKLGGPSSWPDGYAWCKIAAENNVFGTPDQIDMAKANLSDVAERLSKLERRMGEHHAKSIRSRMESFKFDFAKIDKRLKDCKENKKNAKMRVNIIPAKKGKRRVSVEDKAKMERFAVIAREAGVLGETKNYLEMLNKLKVVNHPLKNNLLGLVSRGCIDNNNPVVGLEIADLIEDADLKTNLQLLAFGKLYSLGKEKSAETTLNRLRVMNLESEAMASAAIRFVEEGRMDRAMEVLKKSKRKRLSTM